MNPLTLFLKWVEAQGWTWKTQDALENLEATANEKRLSLSWEAGLTPSISLPEAKDGLPIKVTYRDIAVKSGELVVYPKVLCLGAHCSSQIEYNLFIDKLEESLKAEGLALEALKSFGSIDRKSKEYAFRRFCHKHQIPFRQFTEEELNRIQCPNPSAHVFEREGVNGIAEPSALLMSGGNKLLVEKKEVAVPSHKVFSFAVALRN